MNHLRDNSFVMVGITIHDFRIFPIKRMIIFYNIVVLLNARRSVDVADQYYRSATIGNSKKDVRGLKFGRRSGAVAGATRVWRRASLG